jgi:hypothetical protein
VFIPCPRVRASSEAALRPRHARLSRSLRGRCAERQVWVHLVLLAVLLSLGADIAATLRARARV